jgi:hypothetical protein
MTFYEKYPQLKQKQFLLELVSKSVYATMALEDQTVPMQDIEKIVKQAIEKEELRHGQFFFN